MVTSARRCAGCGGPLPDTPEDQRTITFAFCGIVNDIAHGAPRATTIKIDLTGVGEVAQQAGRTLNRIVLAIVLIVAAIVAGGVAIAVWPAREAGRSLTSQSKQAVDRVRAVEPAELATLADVGWKAVNTAAPPTGWASFEPVANVEWARSVAQGWAPDARLTRIDLNGATPAGIINVSGGSDSQAGYRFISAGRIAEWERIADSQADARAAFELMMQIARERVTVNITRGRPSSRSMPPDFANVRPLGEAIGEAIKSGGFTEFPFYNGYLIPLEREGWVWYLQSLSRRESLPRVRARDGAVFPYR